MTDLIATVYPYAIILLKVAFLSVGLLIAVAYLTYFERKVIGAMQLRTGPATVGIFGLLQPLADGLKLYLKESIVPSKAYKSVYLLAPIITFALSLVIWAVIPLDEGVVLANINVGLIYVLAVSSLAVYGIILAGWSSNSRYALLGGLRAAAQMIAYEVSIGLVVVTVILLANSFNLTEIVLAQRKVWNIVPLFPMFVIFIVSILAETNRAPFDLPEAEAELVSGYNVEYSAMPFALFFLGEYANMILMSALTTVLFLGGWLPPLSAEFLNCIPGYVWFALKTASVLFIFLWVRATFPRYRYDQLMRLGWKIFLPISLLVVILTSAIILILEKGF